MKFFGLREPQLDVPVIEVETDDGVVVDLYNENDLRTVVLRGDDLAFEFKATNGQAVTVLEFRGIRGLSTVQPQDWHPGEANQFEHLLVRRTGHSPRIMFKAGGFEYEFSSEELCVTMSGLPTDSPAADLKEFESDA